MYTNSTLHDYRSLRELRKLAGEMVEWEAGNSGWMHKKWDHRAWRKYLNMTRLLNGLITKICEMKE
jgi:hypothetical protein